MRLFPATTLLGVIDVEERLLAVIPEADQVVARCRRLDEAARLLGVRTVLTEQYPAGLGATPAALAAILPPVQAMVFSRDTTKPARK